jgi:hypothetical protein
MTAAPFDPAELGPPPSEQPVQIDAEGGYQVVPTSAQLRAFEEVLHRIDLSANELVTAVTDALPADHPVVRMARSLRTNCREQIHAIRRRLGRR